MLCEAARGGDGLANCFNAGTKGLLMVGTELRRVEEVEFEGASGAGDEASPTSRPMRLGSKASPLRLAASRSLELSEGNSSFVVRAPDGNVELKVRITDEGPVLCFSAAAIEIENTTSLKIDVDELELRAKKQLHIQSYGDFSQTVAGNSVSHCEGRQEMHAGSLAVTSHRGAMCLDSTEDLSIQGERVLINC